MSVFNAYARYYDLLYRDKDYAGEALFVRDRLQSKKVSPGELLELGRGTGRHAEEFMRLGYSVTGVDFSDIMVAHAVQRAEIIPKGREFLKFQTGDVRTVRLGSQFDAVVSMFHVMNYQTTTKDLQASFDTAAQHLRPGGHFLFDFWYGPAVLSDPPVVRVKKLSDDDIEATRIAQPEVHPNENKVVVNYQVFIRDKQTREMTEICESTQ